jgi:hypothetical protein
MPSDRVMPTRKSKRNATLVDQDSTDSVAKLKGCFMSFSNEHVLNNSLNLGIVQGSDLSNSPFGCWHSTLEFRIDIGQLEYRCLDVRESRIGNGA